MSVTGGMEGIEGKVDCATRITRPKLTVYKIVYIFTIVLVRELKFDSKQPGSATYLVCFHPGSNWGPCACEAHVMATTLQKQAHARNPLQISPVSNVRN